MGHDWAVFSALLTVAIGILMVSNVRYRSFKDLNLKNKVPFVAMLFLVLVFVFITVDPPRVLFGLFFLYAVAGPVETLILVRRARKARVQAEPSEAKESGEK